MALPWKTLAKVPTPDGPLELRQRGEKEYHITINGLILMNSVAHRSEAALGTLGARPVADRPKPRALVAGLGLGITLRAVLDALPPTAQVTVAELNPVVVEWCRGPLAGLTHGSLSDPRVTVEIADVTDVIERACKPPGARFDALVLDLYTGPASDSHPQRDPFYGARAIERMRAALEPGGMLAVWGEAPDRGYTERLTRAGFSVKTERPGKGGLRHVVYLARA